jgi:hypothetical protein
MAGVLKSTLSKRASGGKPSPLKAALAAALAGAAAAALTYRVLRT